MRIDTSQRRLYNLQYLEETKAFYNKKRISSISRSMSFSILAEHADESQHRSINNSQANRISQELCFSDSRLSRSSSILSLLRATIRAQINIFLAAILCSLMMHILINRYTQRITCVNRVSIKVFRLHQILLSHMFTVKLSALIERSSLSSV